MRKKIFSITVMSVFVLSLVFASMGTAQAFSWKNLFGAPDNLPLLPPEFKQIFGSSYPIMNLKLVEKDPSDWSVIHGGAYGYMDATHNTVVNFWGFGLDPRTRYTLIYYGYGGHNDEWPWATCIASGRTFGNRIALSNTYFPYTQYLDNGINEKFWLVKSSDIDCGSHTMTAWNPTEYLFEHNTI